MTQAVAIDHSKANQTANQRPVYTGLRWKGFERDSKRQWIARSETTPITYQAAPTSDGRWAARHGFRDAPGRPFVEIGLFAEQAIAMTACERHDFRFWSTSAERAGITCVFMGSPDHVSPFVEALASHEKDDILDMISGGYALPDGRNFTQSASFFTAVKTGLKQERNGQFTATLSIDAQDLPLWLLQVTPGARMAVGVVDLAVQDSEEWTERAAHALRRSFALAQDNTFHGWMAQKYDRWGLVGSAMQQTSAEVEEAVSETLRRLIGCPSRRELASNRDAILRLEKIDREFYLDMSRGFVDAA